MKAVQLLATGPPGRFEFGTVPDPVPAPDEVIIDVKACGLNHLDLWLEANALPISVRLPRIPGSEVAGSIAEVGAAVTDWKVGARVAVQSNLFCGHCEYCEAGKESLCLTGAILGIQRDGGFAEKVAVPAQSLVLLPEGVSYDTSAALSLAGSTAMHMLTTRASVQPGEWVLVMAAGSGVGAAAIQIATGLGARVVTTGSTEKKRQLGLRLGAVAAVDSTDPTWPAKVRRITEQRGPSLVIEHIGGPALDQVFKCLARDGTVVTCGATAGRDVLFKLWPFFVKEQKLVGSYGRNRGDLQATLDWALQGKLRPVIDTTLSLAETPDAFRLLRERKTLGKILIKIAENS